MCWLSSHKCWFGALGLWVLIIWLQGYFRKVWGNWKLYFVDFRTYLNSRSWWEKQFLIDWERFALATDTNDLWPWARASSSKLCSLLTLISPPTDDYGTLLMAEALLEESLQENMDVLRLSTPLTDNTQPKLCRAKGHLNTILSRGRLTVSQRGWSLPSYSFTFLSVLNPVQSDKGSAEPSSQSEGRFKNLLLLISPSLIPCSPPAQVSERGSAADGQSALCAGSLPWRPGNVCQGGTGGADSWRSAHLPPPPAGWGVRHQRYMWALKM